MAVAATDSTLTSQTRWTIVALLSASITINLLDRQILSVLASELRTAFQWTNAQYGYIAVAFNLGMMCGQIPIGALMDRVGTRLGLAVIFIAWCVIDALHAAAGPGTAIESVSSAIVHVMPGVPVLAAGLAGFILLRFLLGISQCGNYTAGIKALAGLFPAATRSRAGGVFNAGAQLGSVIAPPIVVFLAAQYGWRMAFIIPSVLGLLWLLPWFGIFPDKERMSALAIKPVGHALASGPELGLGTLIRNHKVLGLFLIRVFTGPHHDVLLDLAAALPAHGTRHVVSRDRVFRVNPQFDWDGRQRHWRPDHGSAWSRALDRLTSVARSDLPAPSVSVPSA